MGGWVDMTLRITFNGKLVVAPTFYKAVPAVPRAVGVNPPDPGGALSKILARRVRGRRLFFRRGSRGLLCGWGVALSRGRQGSGGARERLVLKTCALTQSN